MPRLCALRDAGHLRCYLFFEREIECLSQLGDRVCRALLAFEMGKAAGILELARCGAALQLPLEEIKLFDKRASSLDRPAQRPFGYPY
jgi:hypothetical protein